MEFYFCDCEFYFVNVEFDKGEKVEFRLCMGILFFSLRTVGAKERTFT